MAKAPRPPPLEPVQGEPPDFVAELLDEVRAFFRVLRDFTLHPIAFTREWSEGRRRAMNPIGFFGAAVGVELAAAAIANHYRPTKAAADLNAAAPELAWLLDLLASQLPLAKAALFAAVVHWRLKKKGSTQSFRGSLGAVLYAEGWASLGKALAMSCGLAFGADAAKSVGEVAGLAALVMLALALVGAHRLTRYRAAIGPIILGGACLALATAAGTSAIWGPRALAAIEGKEDGLNFNVGKEGVDVSKQPEQKKKP